MVDSTPLIPDNSSTDTKQGHRVFGCLDFWKAVLLINAIALVLYEVVIINNAMKSTFVSLNVILVMVMIISSLFFLFYFYILVMSAALKFQDAPVIIGILLAVIGIIMTTVGLVNNYLIDIIDGYAFSYVLHALMLYADAVYVAEVRKGIMSRETYSREEYSLW